MRINKLVMIAAVAGVLFTGCTDDDTPAALPGVGVSLVQESVGEDVGTVSLLFNTMNTFDTDVELIYELSGTATADTDYTALQGTLVLEAGANSVNQNLFIIDDAEVETDEELIVTLTSVNGETEFISSNSSATLTITDNDSFAYENGILVLHEGNFFGGNASVSYITEDLSTTTNNIFSGVNDAALGDVGQSMGFNGDLAYIVVNNSQKIEVVNRFTFELVGTIDTGLLNPRNIAFTKGKGYVTNWGDGTDATDDFVALINLESFTVEDTYSVPEGPEAIVATEDYIYVAHQGGFGQNNIVTVINANTNTLDSSITVADRPNSMQLIDGALWVLSGGNPSWTGNETAGQLDKIDTVTNSIETTFAFTQTEHPGNLSVDGANLYYLMSGNVFNMNVSDTELPATGVVNGVSFYDMTVNNGKLYGVDAKDFASNGSLEIYDLGSNTLDVSLEVSIIPGAIYFNGGFEF
ncbi:Calx-beta domain-containing protein [Maribacter antarcticus]|uniref:Calx-beta domain-containing protein n=1 Tax=Maribacter antarcticus TaxID=505250 RepID=UPI000686ECB4|nr:DUF5074 domain-containing protein [Maribacter antarcticus]